MANIIPEFTVLQESTKVATEKPEAHHGEILPSSQARAVPNYEAFRLPTIAVGEKGTAPGEFNFPRGVSIEPTTGYIYVSDKGNCRIQIFSQTGDYIHHFGYPHLESPRGILIFQDSIFVTDVRHHAIFKFKIPDLTMVKNVGKKGSDEKELYFPCQLAISPNQHLYIPDMYNDRVQILTTDIEFLDTLRHESLHRPIEVKFSNDEIFLLSASDSSCIHVFTLTGEKSRSLVTRGDGMDVRIVMSFCLDLDTNIVICDAFARKIRVFSQVGKLLHTIGLYGHEAGMYVRTGGVTVDKSTLICVFWNKKFGLQVFSA